MKSVNGMVRLIIELPIDLHRVFKEEAAFRGTTLKNMMMQAFIEKLQGDHSLNKPVPNTGKWGYDADVKYRRTIIEIPLEIHTVIKAEAAWLHLTIKEYITTALIEKMKHDSQYQLDPVKSGGTQ
jgi:hypothetical protein